MSKFGQILALAVAATSFATASHATTYIYTVTVKQTGGPDFQDCFTFKNGILTIHGLPGVELPYTPAPTTPKYYYTAVTNPKPTPSGHALAFSGFKTGNNVSGKVSAVGADNVHDGYAVHGVSTPACPAPSSDVARGVSPYHPSAN